jgi:5,10-methylenetetrahydromethanopterin reductase
MKKNIFHLGFGFGGVYSAAETIAYAQAAEASGMDSVWIAEDYFQGGAFSIASACAVNTKTIQIGIGVINPYTRHPALAAMEAVSLDEISGGRAILAMGASNRRWMELQAGIPYVKPITAAKEAVLIMKGLIRGEEVQFTGDYFRTGPIRLENRARRTDQPIFMGVKGDKALAAAGEVADGVLLSAGSPLAYIRHVKERLAAGARLAGRDPGEIRIAAYLPTYIQEDGAKAVDAMRAQTAHYLGLHGSSPITLTAGLREEETAPFREAFLAGRKADLPVSDRMVDTLVVAGTPEHCRRRIQDYLDAGVDMPVIFEASGVCSPSESLEMIRKYLMD